MTENRLTPIIESTAKASLLLVPFLVILLFLQPSWPVVLFLIVILALAPIVVMNDELTLFLILIIRPIVDIFGEQHLVEIGAIPFNFSSVLSILIIVWSLFRLLAHRKPIWKKPLFWPWLGVLLLMLPSFLWTESLTASIREYVRLASVSLLFFVAFDILSTKKVIRRFLGALALSVIIPAGVAIIQLLSGGGLEESVLKNRVYGTFGHPNVLAFYLILILSLLVVSLPFLQKRWRPRIIAALAILFGLFVMTYTRGAWIGMAIVLIIFGAFFFQKKLAAILLGTAAFLLLIPAISGPMYSVFNVDLLRIHVISRVLDWKSEDSSLDWRVKLWSEMRRKVVERPVFGHGLGTFPILRERQVENYFEGTEAHNDYLRLMIETGIAGVAAYGLLLLSLLGSGIRAVFQSHGDNERRRYAVVFFGLTLAYAFMSYFDNLLQGTAVMWAWWSSFAALLMLTAKKVDPAHS